MVRNTVKLIEAWALIRSNEEQTDGQMHCHRREHSGSGVECLTRDQRAVGVSLTGITVLCP